MTNWKHYLEDDDSEEQVVTFEKIRRGQRHLRPEDDKRKKPIHPRQAPITPNRE